MRDRQQKNRRFEREKPEFDQEIVDIARVTRVMAGGKRMRFRVCLVIGDKKGRVGIGLAKGADVSLAIGKAYKKAEKEMIRVEMIRETIPHEVRIKKGASKVILKPAPIGTGVIAGGAVRVVLRLAGVTNVVGKILGSNNKTNNAQATVEALKMLKKVKEPKKSKNEKIQKTKRQ